MSCRTYLLQYLNFNYLINIFNISYTSILMSEPVQNQEELKKNVKNTSKWNEISSDEDQSESEKSKEEEKQAPSESAEVAPEKEKEVKPKEETQTKSKQAHIVPFDPKKKFRGQFANIKTVKGGFKPEKLEKKKFELDTIRNPFDMGDSSSEEEEKEDEQKTAEAPKEELKEKTEEKTDKSKKLTKKEQLKKEKEELDAALKELGGEDAKQTEQAEKKKKKKKPKKVEQEKAEPQEKKEDAPTEQPVQFQVDKQKLQELIKKKAEAAKAPKKKDNKASITNTAKKALEEREAKNKNKKVFVDL